MPDYGLAYDAELSDIRREVKRLRRRWFAVTGGFLAFLIWLYLTGGPWRLALTTFAITYVVSYVLTGYLHRARVRTR